MCAHIDPVVVARGDEASVRLVRKRDHGRRSQVIDSKSLKIGHFNLSLHRPNYERFDDYES